ncbi:MAG TPA: hypothetical protein VF529_03505 [Solirubrobacteraceae bacterium]|jgi:hypothetical protein
MTRPADLRAALARFEELLGTSARERDYQQLFADCPFVLSRALPLRVEPSDIVPLGRPGRSEPDLLAFPRDPGPIPSYGVIELKRPDAPVIVERRKGLLSLSADAQLAFQQAATYRDQLARYVQTPPQHSLILGSAVQIFVIMGLTTALARKLHADLARAALDQRLPAGARLIPYDALLAAFRSSVPPQITILVPRWGSEFESLVRHLEAHRFDWRNFEVTDHALAFWEDAQRRAASCSDISSVFSRPEWFRIRTSTGLGSIAPESPAHFDFPAAIYRFLEDVVSEAEKRGIRATLERFVAGSRLLQRGADGLSRQAKLVLLRAADDCERRGISFTHWDYSDQIKELELAGLVQVEWVEGRTGAIYVHPQAKHFLESV